MIPSRPDRDAVGGRWCGRRSRRSRRHPFRAAVLHRMGLWPWPVVRCAHPRTRRIVRFMWLNKQQGQMCRRQSGSPSLCPSPGARNMVTSSIYSEISHGASPHPLDVPDPLFFAPDPQRESPAGYAGTVLIPRFKRTSHDMKLVSITRLGQCSSLLTPGSPLHYTTEQPRHEQRTPAAHSIGVKGHHQSCAFKHAQKLRSSPKTNSRRVVSECSTRQPKNCRHSDDTPTRKPMIVAAHRQESEPPPQRPTPLDSHSAPGAKPQPALMLLSVGVIGTLCRVVVYQCDDQPFPR
jgi:hypothetical protein